MLGPMHKWPFPNIPPEIFETLSDDNKRLLEALTQVTLAELLARQHRPPITND